MEQALKIFGSITLLSAAESGALYSLEHAKKNVSSRNKYIIVTMLIYGIAVPFFLYRVLNYNGIGLANFYWNLMSTLSAFFIGWYFFQEDISNVQKIGVGISLLGVALILLGKQYNNKI